MRVVFCFKMEPRYCVSYGRREGRTKGGLASSPSHIIMPRSIRGAEAGWLHRLLKGLILFYVIIPPQWRLSSSINSGWSWCIQITGSLPEEWSWFESRSGLEFVWLKKGGARKKRAVSVWGGAWTKEQCLQKEGNIKYGSINKNCGSIQHGARAGGGVSGSSLCSARGNFIPEAGWGVEVGNRFNQVFQNIMYH